MIQGCKGRKGIDFGCNVGGITFRLQLKNAKMTGVDLDAESLNVARACEHMYLTGAHFVEGKADEIDLSGYDFAVMYSVFHYIVKERGIESAFKFLKRVSETCRDVWIEFKPDYYTNEDYILKNTSFTQMTKVYESVWLKETRPVFHCKR